VYDRFDLSKILRSATIQVRKLAVDFFGRVLREGLVSGAKLQT